MKSQADASHSGEPAVRKAEQVLTSEARPLPFCKLHGAEV